MLFFKYFTPITYWLLFLMWSFIFLFYIKRLKSKKINSRLLFTLLTILAIDAFRTLFESFYFGAWYTSLVGFLPKTVYAYLVRPEIVFIPKALNLIAAVIVIVILLYRWIPQEEHEKEYMQNLVDKQTKKLSESNAKLNKEISERKLIEETLRESEERYKGLFFSIRDAISIADTDRTIVDCNPAFIDLFGYANNEIIGKKTCLLYENGEDFKELGTALIEHYGDSSFLKTVNYKKKNGDVFQGDTKIFYLKDRDNKVIGYIGLIRDISDRNQAEKKLISLEKRYQALLDYSPVCHKIVDLDFNLQFMSANGFKMLKLDQNVEVYGKPYPFEFFPEAFRIDMIEALKKVKNTGKTLTMEALANDFQGNEVWLDSTLLPVLNDDKSINYMTVVTADITQRKLDEKERKRLEEKLIQAQKMEAIGTLAGGIAHDFNNILFPIIGMSELLLEDLAEDSTDHEYALEILTAGKRGAELVKQILAFSRQSEHKMIPVRIQQILKEVLNLLRSTIPSYIEIIQDIQLDCGLIKANPTQIHQIAMNIITNSYHALEENGGKIIVRLREANLEGPNFPGNNLNPGKYAVLSVSDTGNGISAELMDKIFDPYFTTKEKGKGTGLGLAVVYGIVQEHKGDIKINSEIGKGTTFNVYLPLMDKTTQSDTKEVMENIQTGDERILLVDDEPPIAKLVKNMLERLGYSIAMHINSIEALKTFRKNPDSFNMVISDINMPNMTGDQLVREIKLIRSDIPVIICTGFSERINEEKTKILGISGILKKPIIKSEMAEMVRKVLDEHKKSKDE